MAYKSTYKKQKTMGATADAHYQLSIRLDLLHADEREMKKDLEKYEQDAVLMSKEQGNLLARGSVADGVVEDKDHYNMANPAELHKWIRKTGRFEVLQNRVSSTGYRELLKAGHKPPGVKIFTEKVFNTKRRGGKKKDD